MARKKLILVFLIAIFLAISNIPAESPKMNQIQVIGTHNSYHKRPVHLEIAMKINEKAKDWDYEHLPLDAQLDRGVRSFELDIHRTSEGWKVMHVPHFDSESTCHTFQECIDIIKQWSIHHPYHVPIIILVEWKREGPVIDKSIKVPDKNDLDNLDEIIFDVFTKERLIIPDMVRGEFNTLEEAILKKGWPSLDEVRGKVMFVFHNRGELRKLYLEGYPNLEGRAMFVNSRPGESFAGVLIIDNPFEEKIPQWVKMGYIVRVFGGDPKGRTLDDCKLKDEIAFASGAQIISTDNPPGCEYKGNGYVTVFPDTSTIRWNPINLPEIPKTKPEENNLTLMSK